MPVVSFPRKYALIACPKLFENRIEMHCVLFAAFIYRVYRHIAAAINTHFISSDSLNDKKQIYEDLSDLDEKIMLMMLMRAATNFLFT